MSGATFHAPRIPSWCSPIQLFDLPVLDMVCEKEIKMEDSVNGAGRCVQISLAMGS